MSSDLPQNIHFVGIGGIGMSGLAEFLHKEGHTITGSDLKKSEITRNLESKGIEINYQHQKENINKAEFVVYSSAIPPDNPEINTDNIPVIKRAEMLNKVFQMRKNRIAVSGMHGKTTTSSLLTHIFTEADRDPTALIGGVLQNQGTNIRYGQGDDCIVEADEYDQSFLSLYPTDIIITNIEEEHLDCYDSYQDIKDAFSEFGSRINNEGKLIINNDNEDLKELFSDCENTISFGFDKQADYYAKNYKMESEYTKFDLYLNGIKLGSFKLKLPGKHNISNAMACIAMANWYGISIKTIKNALESFSGIQRRMEVKYSDANYTLLDDYAHHPTEIKATLESVRQKYQGRVIAIFQPHLYSRTQAFYKDFAQVLEAADICYVSEIYPAREDPIPGVDSKLITMESSALNYCSKDNIIEEISEILKAQDTVITLGAGDINKIHQELIQELN